MKFNYELATKIRDQLFSKEEQILLSAIEGTVFIDIADQFMLNYENMNIRAVNETIFLKNCAIIKTRQGNIILEQLRVLNLKLKDLMNPKNNQLVDTGFSKNEITDYEESNSKDTLTESTGEVTYDFNEASLDESATNLIRGANTNTSQLNKGLENQWRKDVVAKVAGQLVGQKEFNPNKILQKEKVLDVKEAHYEVIEQDTPEIVPLNNEVYSTIQTSVTGTVDKQYVASNETHLEVNRTDGENEQNKNQWKSADNVTNSSKQRYIENETILTTIRRNIPQLQTKFFSIFWPLFKTRF